MTPYDNGSTKPAGKTDKQTRPSRAEAEAAVETLLRWVGEDVSREGLVGTPARVARAWEEFCVGYDEDPAAMLNNTFEEVEGYDDMVMLRSIRMESHCEHHMVPILGTAHIAYMPDRRVVGISKLARVLDSFSQRLQTLGNTDSAGGRLYPDGAEAARRRCSDRRAAPVHDDSRGAQTRRINGHHPLHRAVPERQ